MKPTMFNTVFSSVIGELHGEIPNTTFIVDGMIHQIEYCLYAVKKFPSGFVAILSSPHSDAPHVIFFGGIADADQTSAKWVGQTLVLLPGEGCYFTTVNAVAARVTKDGLAVEEETVH